MQRLLILILYLGQALIALAQVTVCGRVVSLENKPVGNVIVKMESNDKICAFTSTNAQGEYRFELHNLPSSKMSLVFSHVSYEKKSYHLIAKEGVTKVDVFLIPNNISLKEVTVKPDPLRQYGDSLSYHLAAFLGKNDITLEDGLRRLPGVDVSKNGSISYMGNPIHQFNIEGMDLLGGQYNLATRNIPADYVTQVEIVRNHHSRRVEKDVPSDEVSINIKLNRKAKFKPFGQEEIGVGYEENFRGLLGITGMMFTDDFQTICSLKGSNYKDFARADMNNHFGEADITTPATNLLGDFDNGQPPQGDFLYQRNGMATLNGILNIDSTTTMKANIDYCCYRETHDYSQQSTYLNSNGNYAIVTEQASPLAKVHLPKLSANYLKNSDDTYLSETFVLKGKFERNEGNLVANTQQVEQKREASSFEIGNDVFWMGKTNHGTRRHIHVNTFFKQTPTLKLAFINDGVSYGQTAKSSTVAMNVVSSFNIPINKVFRLTLPVSINARFDNVETYRTLSGDVNYINGWNLSSTLNPGFEIYSKDRRLYLSAGIGASFKGLYYNKLHYSRPVINPSIRINYTFSANNKLMFLSGYNTTIGDMMTLMTEPIQLDYRAVHTSSGIIGIQEKWNMSAGWKWQLPMQYFTLNLSLGHTNDKSNTLYSQSVRDIDISSTDLLRDSKSSSTILSVAITKNYPSIFTKFNVETSYSIGRSEQAVDLTVINIHSNSYKLHGNTIITPVSWLELRYDINYYWARNKYDDDDVKIERNTLLTSNTVGSLTHSGAVHIFPIPPLDLSLDYNHVQQQLAVDQYKNMSLFNASVQCKLKKLVLRLEFDNILNQRSYAYSLFDGINTYSFSYRLCGRTVFLRTIFKL